jgi:hypothetical protein
MIGLLISALVVGTGKMTVQPTHAFVLPASKGIQTVAAFMLYWSLQTREHEQALKKLKAQCSSREGVNNNTTNNPLCLPLNDNTKPLLIADIKEWITKNCKQDSACIPRLIEVAEILFKTFTKTPIQFGPMLCPNPNLTLLAETLEQYCKKNVVPKTPVGKKAIISQLHDIVPERVGTDSPNGVRVVACILDTKNRIRSSKKYYRNKKRENPNVACSTGTLEEEERWFLEYELKVNNLKKRTKELKTKIRNANNHGKNRQKTIEDIKIENERIQNELQEILASFEEGNAGKVIMKTKRDNFHKDLKEKYIVTFKAMKKLIDLLRSSVHYYSGKKSPKNYLPQTQKENYAMKTKVIKRMLDQVIAYREQLNYIIDQVNPTNVTTEKLEEIDRKNGDILNYITEISEKYNDIKTERQK